MQAMTEGSTATSRAVVALAGIVGAVGVMAAAASSHSGDGRNIPAIATICLAHGPTLLALGLAGRGRVLGMAALALALGTLLFVGDLGVREWVGQGLFPGAAPLGGGVMIAGWLLLVLGAVLRR